MEGSDLVLGVTCAAPFDWQPTDSPAGEFASPPERRADRAAEACRLRLRDEVEHPAALHRLRLRRPRVSGDRARLGAAGDEPDGVFLSNGPGDPAVLGYAIDNAQAR